MGFIITTVIVLSSITIIGLWVMQLLESDESLTAWIVTIAIGIIIWICAIVYIKSDNDNTYKEGLSEELEKKLNDKSNGGLGIVSSPDFNVTWTGSEFSLSE